MRKPDAFGIVNASNSCNEELIAEVGRTRGGDGGEAAGGGMDPLNPITPYTIGRRVLALP